MKTLGVDYLDVLLLAGRNSKPDPGLIEHIGKLKEDGQIRYLGVSGHNRSLFPELEKDKEIDVFHIRYNAAHRGAEHEAFDRLPAEGGAGIASFTNTRWGALINPSYMPSGETAPNAADCYRFALSHPRVHVAICGPNSMEQLLEDLTALEKGPMSDSELEHMRKIGDFIYKKVSRVRAQFNSIRSIRWR
jgi:predicted aldo/keto reductase-like oxidoreductase